MFKSNCEVLGLWLWAQLGRQAAWRPRCIRIGVVWLVASCLQMLISVCLFGLGLWAQLGRQAAWRPWCIEMVSSGWWHCLAVAVVIACCGLWFWARVRSSSCLAAEVHSNWCRLVSGIVFAVVVTGNCWDLGSGRGLNLVVWLFGDWKAQSHSGLSAVASFSKLCWGNSFWWVNQVETCGAVLNKPSTIQWCLHEHPFVNVRSSSCLAAG